MNRTEIKFQPNVPVDVLLDRGAEGKEYPSKFEGAESRWYYTVNGNEGFMYLPTSARNQLVRTHAAAGDTVRICKTADGKSTLWRIEVLSDATSVTHGQSHLAQCLCSAVDAAIEASEYARSKNFSVTFLGSDIRAMANSLLIGDQKGAQRG